jgi:hypothetical protein
MRYRWMHEGGQVADTGANRGTGSKAAGDGWHRRETVGNGGVALADCH